MRGFRGRIGAMVGASLAALSTMIPMSLAVAPPPPRRQRANVNRYEGGRSNNRVKGGHGYYLPNGKRERARRLKQIALGSLKHENGLDPAVSTIFQPAKL